MKVAILCGGLGTRLREETEVRPKPMVEIGGRPVLWHIMRGYASHGFKDFVLALGYKGELINVFHAQNGKKVADASDPNVRRGGWTHPLASRLLRLSAPFGKGGGERGV